MVEGSDGGAIVTYNGGKRSSLMNQPTAQFYRVTTDDHFPYRVYGAQQDNSTTPSRAGRGQESPSRIGTTWEGARAADRADAGIPTSCSPDPTAERSRATITRRASCQIVAWPQLAIGQRQGPEINVPVECPHPDFAA
jgi:hypothetical protein